jgi:hypothetical protein
MKLALAAAAALALAVSSATPAFATGAAQGSGMALLANVPGFSAWHYTTPDTYEVVLSPGYFDAFRSRMHVGDVVLGTYETSTSSPVFGEFFIIGVSGPHVLTANGVTVEPAAP